MNEKMFRLLSQALVSAFMLSIIFIGSAPENVAGHAPENIDISYDYGAQVLIVNITHTNLGIGQHYIESIEVFKNNNSIIEETYTSQPDTRTWEVDFNVPAVDGDRLKVIAICSLTPSRPGESEELVVKGPRARMELSVNPEMTFLEMGEIQDFTVNIYGQEDDLPLDGATVEVSATLGEASEISELGLGGYQFTYTAPDLEDEDIEVINITASKNGYHTSYLEFSMDILYPVDPEFKIEVTLQPAFTSIVEGQSKDLTVKVKAGGQDLDVDEITVTRSGGLVSTEKAGIGTFTITFLASEVNSDTQAWINVLAEKEGYQRGERRMFFTIRDDPEIPIDDDDDNVTPSNEKGLLNPATIGILIVILLIIGGIIGFIFYRKKKNREQ